ncbi:MAG: hypothetical protein NVSMB17_06580 [Candidatus Dormibacteria bacterium]
MATGRLLIAGIGYTNLRDVSVGPVISARLAERRWPEWVDVEDFSFGAIDAVHRLRDAGYERALFFGSVDRGDPAGTIRDYTWSQPETPDLVAVQERVAEAAQAVISLETTLVVAGYFKALPAYTRVFEIEPLDMTYGDGFSAPVEAAVTRLEAMLEEEVAAVA